MTLRLFNGYDDDEEELQEASVETSALPRFTNATYTVFPPFGERFRDLSQWEHRWNTLMPGRYRFWPGFTQGGILSLPDL
ncbi:MAG: hypothetical protein KDA68_14575, partial [Planctomycetaceae bacterium]|nr:hypothetical protein [Planctomycetaceae bacterium]